MTTPYQNLNEITSKFEELIEHPFKSRRIQLEEINFNYLEYDPGLHPMIWDNNVNLNI